MQGSRADLHVHTTASDGALTPTQLVEEAAKAGLAAVAVCDHDTIDGLEEAIAAGERFGVEVVPGVEINTDVNAVEIHILGYFFNYKSSRLVEHLHHLKDARHARGRRMVEKLRSVGVPITFERVLEIAGEGAVGRPHVAQAIVETGIVSSMNSAFGKYLVRGTPGFVERTRLTPHEAITIIVSAGGVAGLAHPAKLGRDDLLQSFIKAGLGAIEVGHADHSNDMMEHYIRIARDFELIPTAGSDFHRFDPEKGSAPGAVTADYSIVERLRRASDFDK